jgi:hypothetical protein
VGILEALGLINKKQVSICTACCAAVAHRCSMPTHLHRSLACVPACSLADGACVCGTRASLDGKAAARRGCRRAAPERGQGNLSFALPLCRSQGRCRGGPRPPQSGRRSRCGQSSGPTGRAPTSSAPPTGIPIQPAAGAMPRLLLMVESCPSPGFHSFASGQASLLSLHTKACIQVRRSMLCFAHADCSTAYPNCMHAYTCNSAASCGTGQPQVLA